MANLDEDVIELGSSDEEKEPAPKKKKPMTNVMVQIPNKLPGVTIKPASTNKPKINPVSIAKGTIGKAVTVTKVSKSGSNSKLSNSFANKNLTNGKTPVRKQNVQIPLTMRVPIISPAVTVMPTLKKIRQIPAGKLPAIISKAIRPQTLIRQLPSSTLPPGITVKRTSQLQPVLKRNMKANPVNMQRKIKVNNTLHKKAAGGMVFVDLDDDDAAPCSAGPQWYLRPEEQDIKADKSTESEEKFTDVDEKTSETKTGTNGVENVAIAVEKGATDLKEQNNKEPDTSKYIEITIEDSPAKPQPKSKRTCEVSELAITIDDSPVKGAPNKPASPSGSDEETTASKEKHSKKKLEYKITKVPETVEIEIELIPVEDDNQNDKTDPQDNVDTEIVEIVESPLKQAESFHTSTPKKKVQQKQQPRTNDNTSVSVPKPMLKLDGSRTTNVPKPNSKSNEVKTVTTNEEFHPVYQSFIDLCFRLENSEDMNKIVEKKIKAYYKQVPKEYTESEMFVDMVASKISAMKAGPEKMYLFIKDVVDELNLQRKIAKTQPPKVVTVNKEQEKFLYGEDSEFDSKRQRQIRKLEKTLKKLHRAIQKLEEQEVDFDDEEDSVYLLTESEEETSKDHEQPLEKSELLKRYKERMIRVHAKFCQLTNTKMPSEPRVQIDARPGQPKGPAKRLEKWINKKVPIGTPLPFPDFHDVLRCVRDANQEDKLGWNEADIMEEARDLFTRCGKKLQRRRQENEWRLAASRIQSELDPAEESEILKKALEDNRRVASKKESEVLNKFADRQNQLNLEAVEIGDKEADESPVETDEEEPTEESTSLQTKEKRKERLKRLLQKNTKTDAEKKEQADVETKDNDESQDDKTKESENKDKKSKDKTQMETENEEKDPLSDKRNDVQIDPLSDNQNNNKDSKDSESVHTLSEDSSKIDSDIDELHLLQKLHSNVVDSSTLESSDSESPIAISDTLSSGDNRKHASDVISIENSSYSESEKNNEHEYELISCSQKKIVTESVNVQIEIECSNAGVEKKINKSNNDEYNESVEDILLASSDDEASKDANSKGDPISINETNKEQSKDNTKGKTKEPLKENVDNTDATSMDSVEMSVAKNAIESSEVTSITSDETVDDDITNAVEVNNISSVETVECDTMENPVKENVPVTCAKLVKTVNDTDKKSPENDEDIAMISLTENDKTSDELSNVKSGVETENKPKEVRSSKLSVDDNITDKHDTTVVINNGENKTSVNTEDDDVNVEGSVEKVSNLPVPEPMEVDDNNT